MARSPHPTQSTHADSFSLAVAPIRLFALRCVQDEDECEAEAPLCPSDPAVAARVALVVHPSSSSSGSQRGSSPSPRALASRGLGGEAAPAAGGSLIEFALENSAIDVTDEEKAELKKLNKKLNRMHKNAAVAASAASSSSASSSNSSAAARAVSGMRNKLDGAMSKEEMSCTLRARACSAH